MDEDARLGVVDALVRLARSDDYRDRAEAGRCLAGFAELPAAHVALSELVDDSHDTYVTTVTAEALLRRKDKLGLALVAAAWGAGSVDCIEQLAAAVRSQFLVFGSERDTALSQCQALAGDPSQPDAVRAGTDGLIVELTSIDPLLRPA